MVALAGGGLGFFVSAFTGFFYLGGINSDLENLKNDRDRVLNAAAKAEDATLDATAAIARIDTKLVEATGEAKSELVNAIDGEIDRLEVDISKRFSEIHTITATRIGHSNKEQSVALSGEWQTYLTAEIYVPGPGFLFATGVAMTSNQTKEIEGWESYVLSGISTARNARPESVSKRGASHGSPATIKIADELTSLFFGRVDSPGTRELHLNLRASATLGVPMVESASLSILYSPAAAE